MTEEVVKQCACCRTIFTAMGLVNDPAVRPIGTAFLDEKGTHTHYYFFQHETPQCGTSFVVDVEHFRQFITEPIPEQVLRLGPKCEGRCVRVDDLNECRQECHFAPFRRFLLRMIAQKLARIQRAPAP